jgi:glycosyltransferase involved in cell wall biosynthesis
VGYIGVELDAFAPAPEARAPEPTILYLGRLKRYKRIEVLLEALERTPEAVLDIAGEGDHRPALEREIASRGLTDRVRMHGHVREERKRELYQRAWVNVTASSAEGWALSVMEAAACATPTAALAVGGLLESVEDGRTGLLAHDTDDLATCIQLILRDPELRDSLGAAALERARAFTWDATARRTLEVLESQVAGASLPGVHGDPPALDAATPPPADRAPA